jgi:hypothetical protein
MKNNTKSMYALCLMACLMALLNIDYTSLTVLDVTVVVVVLIAAISVIYNIIINKGKK